MNKFDTNSPPRHNALLLPLWNKVVFVDWNGVLCGELFWQSIISDSSHPYFESVSRACENLFCERNDFILDWMRGRISSEDVVSSLDVKLDKRVNNDYLFRRLLRDCGAMRCNSVLISALRRISSDSFLVLATDNMDCFDRRVHLIDEITSTFDAMLSSSSIGILKSDDVEVFFGEWLDSHHLTFDNALLIDDSVDNCHAFVNAGGEAIVFKDTSSTVQLLDSWIQSQSTSFNEVVPNENSL